MEHQYSNGFSNFASESSDFEEGGLLTAEYLHWQLVMDPDEEADELRHEFHELL